VVEIVGISILWSRLIEAARGR
jgi:DNA-binding FrmR family transcriptional regulator